MSTPSFQDFARRYQETFARAVAGWDLAALERVAEVLRRARDDGRTVLVAGNGGSAAICNHLECDATKGTHHPGCAPLNTRSLSANPSVLTALGNDIGFDVVFERQVEYYARPADVLMLISSSGNSPNVVRACEAAKGRGMITVGFVGFSGGRLKDLCDHVLHIPFDNYGISEDMHQASMHVITQWLNLVFRP
ncbi:MAG: SIS domain-containing protein [Deltaproteobacteria bacterium]|nr:SIS domain-containing protein [Deltaproteobacteria bacterium]